MRDRMQAMPSGLDTSVMHEGWATHASIMVPQVRLQEVSGQQWEKE